MGITVQKILGGVLLALILVVGIRMFGDILMPKQEYDGPPMFVADADATAVAEEEPEPKSLAVLLAEATVDAGQRAARACAACHTFEQGGANRVGPNLYNIMGAPKAAVEGFNYSNALAGLDGTWGFEEMDAFLKNPSAYAPGNRMTFGGVADDAARAALLLYMREHSDDPLPLPEPEEEEEAEEAEDASDAQGTDEGEGDVG